MESEDGLHDDVVRRSESVIIAGSGLALVIGAIVLSNLSVTGSPDSSCESILDSRAVWATESYCGIAHIGTVVVAGVVLSTGTVLLVLAWLSSRGHRRPVVIVERLTALVAMVGLLATVWLGFRVVSYDDLVPRRGWGAIRNVCAVATGGLCIVAVVIRVACQRSRNHHSERHARAFA